MQPHQLPGQQRAVLSPTTHTTFGLELCHIDEAGGLRVEVGVVSTQARDGRVARSEQTFPLVGANQRPRSCLGLATHRKTLAHGLPLIDSLVQPHFQFLSNLHQLHTNNSGVSTTKLTRADANLRSDFARSAQGLPAHKIFAAPLFVAPGRHEGVVDVDEGRVVSGARHHVLVRDGSLWWLGQISECRVMDVCEGARDVWWQRHHPLGEQRAEVTSRPQKADLRTKK